MKSRGTLLPILATVILGLCTVLPVHAQSGTSGTYGTLTVTGTASVNALDLQGNSAIFGSWITDPSQPGVTFGYSEGTGGTSAAFTTVLTRPVATANWLRLDGSGNAWPIMELDPSNRLILTGTQISGAGSIVIDPTLGQITINGQMVVTGSQIQNLSISSAGIGTGDTVGASSIGVGTNVTASGADSSAFGYGTTASGAYSFAAGIATTAQAYDSVVLGAYNVPSGNATNWISTDPLFTIGNGTGSTSLSTALTVLKNGNVGIGSPNPVTRLGIYSSGTTSDIVSISSTSARLDTFDAFGYLGIGASDTGYPLFIYKPTTNCQCVLQQGGANTADFIFENFQQAYEFGLNTGGFAGFGIRSNTSGAMRLLISNTTGNIGIATTTPLSKLDVNGSVATGAYAGTTAAPANGMIVSGSVGIGTSSPQAKLDVNGPVMVSGSGSAVLINPQGDLSMGPFTSGTIPQ
jgi:hypothetical protein